MALVFPEEVKSENFSDYSAFIEAVYSIFVEDFVTNIRYFRHKKIVLKKHPIQSGKEVTFWHIISSGISEEQKIPETERCCKIRWIRFMVDNAHSLHLWENSRTTNKGVKTRWCISDEDFSYIVILEERDKYVLLWTAYPLSYGHSRKKARKEFELYKARIAQ